MKRNVGLIDRIVRFVIAAVFIALPLTGIVKGNDAIVFYVLAGIVTLTGIMGFCGLYTVCGLNSCKLKNK